MVTKLKRDYSAQKSNAARRGIEWKLTFQEWIDWWGVDIEMRGSRRDSLQMQRFHDKGPYEIGNIKKGRPADNSKTNGICQANKRTEARRLAHEEYLNSLIFSPSKDERDSEKEEYSDFDKMARYRQPFAIDKSR